MIEAALIAAAAAVVAGAAGSTLLFMLRGRSIGAQVAVAALTGIASVAAGALAAAKAMFISSHDLQALLVVTATAGAVATVAAVGLGRRIASYSRDLGALARSIGAAGAPNDGEGHDDPGGRWSPWAVPVTVELADLKRELDEMSRRLDESRRQERALDSSRRELVAWVSHDLLTPLAGIRAMAEALEDGVADDPVTVERYHRNLRVEADRLALLVDDLFELSRIQAGVLRLQLERASLGDLVSDALAASAPVAQAKGVRLEGRVAGDAPDLNLSTSELSRALRNLLENAIRHTPSDGAVSVQVGVESGRAVVSVADGCGGIPDSDIHRVFEPAFRGEGARTPAANGGGGLGLAIVRGIVEAHDGEIVVHNEGPGCRFTLRLPMVEPA